MDDDIKNELLEKLKSSNNVLVTVNRNPSVDQLAGSIGFSLLLNKLNKHSTTVFSGLVPEKLDFLEPEKTIETNTDSLRDFIISLDKEKADKLKYKQEDGHVKIFITPYRTSITEADLEFSQGDFNVDLIIVLGAVSREELDQAIVSHGRILHDATIATIGTVPDNTLGSINYFADSSSICEILTSLSEQLAENLIDNQIATAFLTGIVSETDRFSNNKTSSETLAVSSRLVAVGANQQLVATKLSENTEVTPTEPVSEDVANNLKIRHNDLVGPVVEDTETEAELEPEAEPVQTDNMPDLSEIEEANQLGKLSGLELPEVETNDNKTERSEKYLTESRSGKPPIIADEHPEVLEPSIDVLSGQPTSNASSYDIDPNVIASDNNQEIDAPDQTKIDEARQEVDNAMLESDQPIKPIESLNAQPIIEIDHQELNPDHNIKVDEDGRIIVQDEDSDLSSNENKPHELKLNPIHDLKKNVLDNLSKDSPPPVPPPIPLS